VDQGAISSWELGQHGPHPRTLRRLADPFHLDVDEMAREPAERHRRLRAGDVVTAIWSPSLLSFSVRRGDAAVIELRQNPALTRR